MKNGIFNLYFYLSTPHAVTFWLNSQTKQSNEKHKWIERTYSRCTLYYMYYITLLKAHVSQFFNIITLFYRPQRIMSQQIKISIKILRIYFLLLFLSEFRRKLKMHTYRIQNWIFYKDSLCILHFFLEIRYFMPEQFIPIF